MMKILSTKFFYVIGAIIFTISVYFFGYSNGETTGYQKGYKIGLEEYKPKYEYAIDAFNKEIEQSNKQIEYLQNEADKAYLSLKEFQEKEKEVPVLPQEEQIKPSFSPEMITQINRLIEK
nr:MAG TPA: hypothetical protein [Caudoviricetes sp.]